MCWVMPPASPDCTLAWRRASSSDVLPWSTWPMIVTTGGRASRWSSLSGLSNRPSSTSDSATRLTVWPSSSATSCAVSASMTSLIVAIWPCFISSLMTSTARSDMRLASSWMVIVSGRMISRWSLSFCSAWCPLRRWVRRRNAATERVRSSAVSPVAVETVRRPRSFCGPTRVGRGGSTTLVGMPGRRMIRLVSSSSLGARGAAGTSATGPAATAPAGRRTWLEAAAGAGSPPVRRRVASCSARRLASVSCRRRMSSSCLRASAAARSTRSRSSRSARSFASASARRRSSSSRSLAPDSARARASRSSSVSVRRTTPRAGGDGRGVGVDAGATAAGAGVSTARARMGAGVVDGGGGAGDAFATTGAGAGAGAAASRGGAVLLGGVMVRLFFISTTTVLVRPCEKLCLTTPASTGRFSDSVLEGVFVSFICARPNKSREAERERRASPGKPFDAGAAFASAF